MYPKELAQRVLPLCIAWPHKAWHALHCAFVLWCMMLSCGAVCHAIYPTPGVPWPAPTWPSAAARSASWVSAASLAACCRSSTSADFTSSSWRQDWYSSATCSKADKQR